MNEIPVNETIRYIAGTEQPLSAEIGIVEEGSTRWLYDVGNGDTPIAGLTGAYHIGLSHFHADHIGNIGRLRVRELYVSKETYGHLPPEMAGACSFPIRIGSVTM